MISFPQLPLAIRIPLQAIHFGLGYAGVFMPMSIVLILKERFEDMLLRYQRTETSARGTKDAKDVSGSIFYQP